MKRSSLIALLLAMSALEQAECQIQGDVHLLELAAKGVRANFESIRTWKGTATLEDEMWVGKDGQNTRTQVEFVHDAVAGNVRWNTATGDMRSSQMVLGDERFKLGPYETIDDGSHFPVALTIDVNTKDYIDGLAEECDPTFFFSCVTDIPRLLEDTPRLFNTPIRNSDNLGSDSAATAKRRVSVQEIDGRIVLEFRKGEVFNRYEFDPSSGYNLVRYAAEDPGAKTYWSFEFVSLRRVFVPRKWTYEGENATGTDNARKFVRRWEIVKQVVNEPLAQSEFSLAAMGLSDGDTILDRVRGVTLTYPTETGQLPPELTLPHDPSVPGLGRYFIYLIVAVTAIAAAMVVARLFRRGT